MPTEPINRQEERAFQDKGRLDVQKLNQRLEELKAEYVSIDTIYPNPYNPNRQSEHEFELLQRSIQEDGFTQPIVVQRSSKMIVDGEHRWRAMQRLGADTIPVVFVDMTDEQMRIATLRHNRARGSEDIELSIQILKDLRELGALDVASYSLDIDDIELQTLLSDLPAPQQMEADEFSQAWIPSKTPDAHDPEKELSDRTISTSSSAVQVLKEIDKKYDDATTHLEAREISTEAHFAVNQVSATFKDQDAALVRSVLGKRPAQRLLEICVTKVLSNKNDYSIWLYEIALQIKARWDQ